MCFALIIAPCAVLAKPTPHLEQCLPILPWWLMDALLAMLLSAKLNFMIPRAIRVAGVLLWNITAGESYCFSSNAAASE
jgi:hypothetical protein